MLASRDATRNRSALFGGECKRRPDPHDGLTGRPEPARDFTDRQPLVEGAHHAFSIVPRERGGPADVPPAVLCELHARFTALAPGRGLQPDHRPSILIACGSGGPRDRRCRLRRIGRRSFAAALHQGRQRIARAAAKRGNLQYHQRIARDGASRMPASSGRSAAATYGGTRSMATRLSTTVWPALSNAISSCSGNGASVELLM